MSDTEVAIVGAGPVGIELHAALRSAGVAVRHLEAGAIGHTMSWWAPQTRFFSSPDRIAIAGVPLTVPGQDKATGDEYRRYLVGVAQQFELDIETFRGVRSIGKHGDGFELEIVRSTRGVGGFGEPAPPAGSAEETLHARRIVLTIGNMHAPRRLGVPGEDLPHVSHYLGDPLLYVGRRVLIIGGKNSAVEAAIRLHRAGAAVTMAYRRDAFDADRIKYWLLPELEWLIDKDRIRFLPGSAVERIDERSVTLRRGGASVEIETDVVLALTGYVQDPSLFDQLGLDRIGAEQRPAYDHDTMETNVPGVFVAGTACGGSQRRARVFIENSHAHVDRICRAITGKGVPWAIDPALETLTEKHEER